MHCSCCEKEFRNGDSIIMIYNGLIHRNCENRHEKSRIGRNFPCPQCKTAGVVDHKTLTYKKEVSLGPGESPACGWNGCWGCHECRNKVKTIDVPAKIRCDLCDGHGYTKKEPQPVTAVVGWKV